MRDKKYEIQEVYKFGVKKRIKVDLNKNEAKEDEIKKILKKDQCIDIFKDAKIDGEKDQFSNMSHAAFIKYKFEKKSREIITKKLSLLMNLKML